VCGALKCPGLRRTDNSDAHGSLKTVLPAQCGGWGRSGRLRSLHHHAVCVFPTHTHTPRCRKRAWQEDAGGHGPGGKPVKGLGASLLSHLCRVTHRCVRASGCRGWEDASGEGSIQCEPVVRLCDGADAPRASAHASRRCSRTHTTAARVRTHAFAFHSVLRARQIWITAPVHAVLRTPPCPSPRKHTTPATLAPPPPPASTHAWP
jgi:hypothetical protein